MHIIFTYHAKRQMNLRGVTAKEAEQAILKGEKIIAKHGRAAYRLNFQFNSKWGEKFYHIKQVMPVTKQENGTIIVITVYAFYF